MANHNGHIRTEDEMKVLFENLEIKAQMTGDSAYYPGIELIAIYNGKEIAVVRMEVDIEERAFHVMWWPPSAYFAEYDFDQEPRYLLDITIDDQLPLLEKRIIEAQSGDD